MNTTLHLLAAGSPEICHLIVAAGIVIALAALPFFEFAIVTRRGRRIQPGRCETCTYPTAGLPQSDCGRTTCPECGVARDRV